MTEQQAYAAMFHFLERFYDVTKSDDVGGLLGSMSLLEDGLTADPAIIDEWRESVEYALNGGRAGSLNLHSSQGRS